MLILRWILSLVLALAAGLKMGGIGTGPDTLFGTLPEMVRWAIVASELALAAWLVSDHLPKAAAFATITLLSIFMAAVIVELGKPVPQQKNCGCFGPLTAKVDSPTKTLQTTLTIDITLIALATAAWFTVPKPKPLPPTPSLSL